MSAGVVERLWATYHEPIYRYILQHIDDEDEAADVDGILWLRVTRFADKAGAHEAAWIWTLAKHEVATYWRKQYRGWGRKNRVDLAEALPHLGYDHDLAQEVTTREYIRRIRAVENGNTAGVSPKVVSALQAKGTRPLSGAERTALSRWHRALVTELG